MSLSTRPSPVKPGQDDHIKRLAETGARSDRASPIARRLLPCSASIQDHYGCCVVIVISRHCTIDLGDLGSCCSCTRTLSFQIPSGTFLSELVCSAASVLGLWRSRSRPLIGWSGDFRAARWQSMGKRPCKCIRSPVEQDLCKMTFGEHANLERRLSKVRCARSGPTTRCSSSCRCDNLKHM